VSRRRQAANRQHARESPLPARGPIDDQVEHPVLEQELAALEALGQLLADRLLDDARAGEPSERLRLGDVRRRRASRKLAVTPPVVGS
jgi:hypothetical protein